MKNLLRQWHLQFTSLVVWSFLFSVCNCADDFQYLPRDLQVDKSIPTPYQHLGFSIGERHLQHHQLVSYLRRLAKISPRISMKIYGYSHGARPCVMLTITSEKNRKRLDAIKKSHRDLSRPVKSASVRLEDLPAVINMGYGVHGDESSASNAAAVVGYYLAAAKGAEINRILDHCVILLDPSLNPDGFNRFASWANGHVGRIQNPDPNHAEHIQPFPGGRVNYYWFDLNRDWLPAQHPESQGRLREYHQWKPNVVLDFHEMGTNSTYFFQPGITARNNPLTPKKNFELTKRMALYHAKALDKQGVFYMTEERFDDFYMGKGSTYPDLHGSVGILFEQASSRGHRQDSANGEITFPFTIGNQVTTTLSSLAATVDLRKELLEYKKKFFQDSITQAKKANFRYLEFRVGADRSRLHSFAKVLLRHDIQVFEKSENGQPVLVIPANQPEYRFLVSLIEKRTHFRENIFYDVSTWHLPSAFGLKTTRIKHELPLDAMQKLSLENLEKKNAPVKTPPSIAYVIDWRSAESPALAGELLRQNIKIRVAAKPFSITTEKTSIQFPHGTLMIPVGIQPEKSATIRKILSASMTPVFPVQSGLTPDGIDLGSNEFIPVRQPKTAMLIGSGVNRYEAGEVWHLFDTRLKLPLSMIDVDRLGVTNISKYNTLVLVSGTFRQLGEKSVSEIRNWVDKGGNLILIGSAINWAKTNKLVQVDLLPAEPLQDSIKPPAEKPIQLPFANARDNEALQRISGAIFDTLVDPTHPIGYGVTSKNLPVFRNNRIILKPSKNPYRNPVVYTADPQISGYCSQKNVDLLRNSAAVIAERSGTGTVIMIPQDPNFRAFWYGTNRLMFNAVFFGSMAK